MSSGENYDDEVTCARAWQMGREWPRDREPRTLDRGQEPGS
jgi:hypothetical protein